MSFEIDPPYTAQQRNGIWLMIAALLAALSLFTAWFDAKNERGAQQVRPIHHEQKGKPS